MVKGGEDLLATMTLLCLAASFVSIVGLLFFLPFPRVESWGFLACSLCAHLGYKLCLVAGYRRGAFGQVYPMARGGAALVVLFLSFLFVGDVALSQREIVAVVVIGLAIMSLAFVGGRGGEGEGEGEGAGSSSGGACGFLRFGDSFVYRLLFFVGRLGRAGFGGRFVLCGVVDGVGCCADLCHLAGSKGLGRIVGVGSTRRLEGVRGGESSPWLLMELSSMPCRYPRSRSSWLCARPASSSPRSWDGCFWANEEVGGESCLLLASRLPSCGYAYESTKSLFFSSALVECIGRTSLELILGLILGLNLELNLGLKDES